MVTSASRRIFRFDGIVVDQANHQLTSAGQVRRLEPKSFRVLVYLLENPGRTISKEELLREVWAETFVTDNALTRAITQLRKALDDDPKAPRYIETVPTVGYRFIGILIAEPVLQPSPGPAKETAAPSKKAGWSLRFVWALAMFLALVVAGGLWWRSRRSAPHSGELQLTGGVQFTAGNGLDVCPAFSPDGRWEAYASDRSGSFRIYVRSAGGGREVAITSGVDQNLFPSFSPDSRWIAFSNLGRPGIFRVPVLGGAIQRLSDFGREPVWSPDGRRIVFRSGGVQTMSTTDRYYPPDSSLWLMNADGTGLRQITSSANGSGQAFPSWNVSGKQIRYANYQSGHFEMWMLDVETGKRRLLFRSADRSAFGSAIFTPDDRWMLYISSHGNGEVGIWAQAIQPDSLTPVGAPFALYRPNVGVPRDLALTADGKHIAYSATVPDSSLRVLQLDNSRPSRELQPLTRDSPYRYLRPRWMPDGSAVLAAKVQKSKLAQIVLLTYPDGDVSDVAPSNEVQGYPQASPDGRRVYFLGNAPTGRPTYLKRMELPDGIAQPLAEMPNMFTFPALAPDESNIVYQDGPSASTLWRLNLRTLQRSQIATGQPSLGYPIYSHDGRTLTLERLKDGNSDLAIMPSDGQAPVTVLAEGTYFVSSWSRDDSKIVFANLDRGLWNLGWINVKSRVLQPLTLNHLARTYYRYPDLSADGRRIVFEYNETKGNLFLADLN